jgi:predicted metalloprotease
MRLEGRRESGNVEDRRGTGMGVGLPVGGGVGGLVLILLISWLTGTNPLDLISQSSVPQDQSVGTTGVP